MLLYSASLPTYKSKLQGSKSGKPDDNTFRADDPANARRLQAFLDSVD